MVAIVLMNGAGLLIPNGQAAVRRGEEGKGVAVFDAAGHEIYAHYLPVSAVFVNGRKVDP